MSLLLPIVWLAWMIATETGAPAGSAIWQQPTRFQSAHFQLTTPRGSSVERLLDDLERAYADVRGFGLRLPPRIDVTAHGSTDAFVRATGAQRHYLAMTLGRRIHTQPPLLLYRRGETARVLRHELVHVALAHRNAAELPRWLNEGLAVTVAGERFPGGKQFRSLDELERALDVGNASSTARSGYAAAGRLVAELIERAGRSRVVALIRAVHQGESFDAAFERIVGGDPRQWGDSTLRAWLLRTR